MFLRGAHVAPKFSTRHTKKKFTRIFSALTLPSCRLVVFINTNTYILTGGTNFKTSLNENYSIALDSCKLHIYLKNVENGFEHDVDSSYGVSIF